MRRRRSRAPSRRSAQLSLGRGDVRGRRGALRACAGHTRAHGTRDPAFLFTHADLVEALVRSGRAGGGRARPGELEAGATLTGGAWARAAVHRCRGLLGPVAEVEAAPGRPRSPRTHDPAMPFEAARTQLALGERLRRARRPADARVQLAAARDAFARDGRRDVGGARRAASSPRPAVPGGAAATGAGLTARERDVCDLVVAGRTNREVAACCSSRRGRSSTICGPRTASSACGHGPSWRHAASTAVELQHLTPAWVVGVAGRRAESPPDPRAGRQGHVLGPSRDLLLCPGCPANDPCSSAAT